MNNDLLKLVYEIKKSLPPNQGQRRSRVASMEIVADFVGCDRAALYKLSVGGTVGPRIRDLIISAHAQRKLICED
jgi:hypothetical protein